MARKKTPSVEAGRESEAVPFDEALRRIVNAPKEKIAEQRKPPVPKKRSKAKKAAK